MAILRVFASEETERRITTIEALRALVPADPELHTLYALDLEGRSIQVWFGYPDRQHHRIKVVSADGVEKTVYDTVPQATAAFLSLAESALR